MGTSWREHLTALLAAPYAGKGGKFALALALGVTPQSLKGWLAGRCGPTWRNREALERLAQEKGLLP